MAVQRMKSRLGLDESRLERLVEQAMRRIKVEEWLVLDDQLGF